MRKVLFAFAGLAALSSAGFAQTLTTDPANNGSGGVFMQLTAKTIDLFVTSFATPFTGTVGTDVDVEVYIRAGAYAGFTGSNDGWTLHDTVSTVRNGTTVNSDLILNNWITVGTGGPLSVYLHAISAGGGVRYTGTAAAPPQTFWENDDITLFSDVARTGAVPFAGSEFTPRTFSGDVNYEPVPEPATLAALGLGAVALLRRRKKA